MTSDAGSTGTQAAVDPVADPGGGREVQRTLRERLRGPWRVTVAEGSMLPDIAPGDWLLIDPTTRRWPRPGSVVVFREPVTDDLAIKRVRARGGERVPFNGGYIALGEGEAWLEADATPAIAAAAGYGPPIDSDRFGPVPVDLLVGRVWFRYGPWKRIGRIGRIGPPTTP
ncbi:MAG: hypothetical protein EPO00_10405 [Chloroflexota bacterium]|nr:MAG: hypothetical protein EPO00_10405 [Chloroflexota bacterium]